MRSFGRGVMGGCAMIGCAFALSGCEEASMYRATVAPGSIAPVRGGPAVRAPGYVETLDDARFTSQVIASPTPVLVDCWAPWCGPCRGMDPTVADLAREWGGAIRVGKLDVTTSPRTAERYGVSALPAFLVFRNGVVVKRVVGYLGKENLRVMVEAAAR